MANIIDVKYLDNWVERIRNYESPTDSQQLIIILSAKKNRSDDDNRNLDLLLKVEEKADELAQAIADAKPLIDAEKQIQREANDAKRQLIWMTAIETASKKDQEVNALLSELRRKVYDKGYITASDKDYVKADYDTLVAKVINDKQANISKEFLNKPGNSI